MARGLMVAVIVGAGIALQVRFLGRLSGGAGPVVVGLLVSAAGTCGAASWIAVTGDWASVGRTLVHPGWVAAGLLGLAIVGGLGVAAARGGATAALAGSIAGQLILGVLLDRIDGREVRLALVGGALVLLAGAMALLAAAIR